MERWCRGCKRSLTPDETSFIKDGLPYCCAGCAAGTGCTCAPAAGAGASPRRSALGPERATPLEAHLNEWAS
jgi:hypothetical protein